ncbi:hypothetical protein Gohar_008050, partial [Gossypium harknessii]|nr:hypothetical protein [Gossypium harknessii]
MDPFADAIYGAGRDLIETELVNDQYVMNKLKLILFPFLHKGHWMRETETSTLTYKPSIDDVNAPDLYIPLMAFGTYVVLAGFFLGISGKQVPTYSFQSSYFIESITFPCHNPIFQCRFSPEALGVQATNGMLGWLFQVLLEATLHTFGDGDVPFLDIVAYGGYTFVAVSITIVWRTIWSYSLYVVAVWECLSMGMLLVKIIKRILIAEVRRSEKHSSKGHYLLLRLAVALLACKYSTL